MTNMEGRCSLGESPPLATRDRVLSRLAGVEWPSGPLLDLLNLPPGADLLDVGAGDGRLLRALQMRGHVGRLMGLDPAPGSPEVLAGEAGSLPFPDGSFDVVTLVRVLGHLPDVQAALGEAGRVLRPGGRVVLAAHGKGHLWEMWRALGRPPGGPGPEEALREALTQAGWVARRLDARLPVTLAAADTGALARAYGLDDDVPRTALPLQDTLHLALYMARC